MDRSQARDALVGAEGFYVAFFEIDLKPGGVFHYCMRSPDGKEYWNKGVFHEIITPAKIVSTMYFSDKDGKTVGPEYYGLSPECPSEMRDTVTFEAVDGDKTRLTLNRKNIPTISGDFLSMMNQGWNQSAGPVCRGDTAKLKFSAIRSQRAGLLPAVDAHDAAQRIDHAHVLHARPLHPGFHAALRCVMQEGFSM